MNRAAQAIVPRTAGESMMVGAMSSLGPKQRRLLKGLSLVDQVESLLPEEYGVVPLMANLAVDQSKRRSGLGLALFEAAKEMCAAWGFDQLWLEVEASNEPARKFYETVKALVPSCALRNAPFATVDLFISQPSFSVLPAETWVRGGVGKQIRRRPSHRCSRSRLLSARHRPHNHAIEAALTSTRNAH